MLVAITTEAATVEVSVDDAGYSPDVMNDLCARAVHAVVEVHQKLGALEVD